MLRHAEPAEEPSRLPTWTFRVHAECWDLVSCRVSDPAACATVWCKALISLNWNLYPLLSGPRIPETPRLLMTTKPPCGKNYRRLSLQQLPSFEGLAAELGLSHIPTFQKAISLDQLGLYAPSHESLVRPGQGTDVFAKLPEEILQQIIRFTPTLGLLSLRLASRPAAYVSRMAALPRSFWLSRFTPPFEMGFALPERHDPDLDWRALYFLIRRALRQNVIALPRADSFLARLAKRRHWWERLGEIAELYSHWGPGRELEGIQFTGPTWLHHKKYAAAQLKGDWGKERRYLTVRMPFSAAAGTLSAVGMSTVKLSGQRYISGLRFFYGGSRLPECLGYVLERAETVVHLEEGESLRGIKVRFNADAIQALKLVLGRHPGGLRVTEWIGDVGPDPSREESSRTTALMRSSGEAPCEVAASFDHFRMLAIGFLEEAVASTDKDLTSSWWPAGEGSY
ncbi:hypothetical protein MFIFM68171_06230 [Madurella fahalii]|uniref:F-box domain-containing protein n=1 Tax=Madurella fahalii TaxID=1157608 RepID=A0ABQ0GEP1_9PEZI